MDHNHDDDIPILELADDERSPTEADAPLDDLPVLSAADDDVYQLSRPKKLVKANPKPAQREQRPVAPRSPKREEPAPREASPPRKIWLWVTLGFCGVAAFVTVAVVAIRYFGDEDAQKVADQIRNHPIVFEQLGGIDECKMNFVASLNEGGKRTDVFDVRGPDGNGQLVTYELFYSYRSIKLRTTDGEWELLDGRENGVAQNPSPTSQRMEPPSVSREAPVPMQTQPVASPQAQSNPRIP